MKLECIIQILERMEKNQEKLLAKFDENKRGSAFNEADWIQPECRMPGYFWSNFANSCQNFALFPLLPRFVLYRLKRVAGYLLRGWMHKVYEIFLLLTTRNSQPATDN